jgi:hypothetical protein
MSLFYALEEQSTVRQAPAPRCRTGSNAPSLTGADPSNAHPRDSHRSRMAAGRQAEGRSLGPPDRGWPYFCSGTNWEASPLSKLSTATTAWQVSRSESRATCSSPNPGTGACRLSASDRSETGSPRRARTGSSGRNQASVTGCLRLLLRRSSGHAGSAQSYLARRPPANTRTRFARCGAGLRSATIAITSSRSSDRSLRAQRTFHRARRVQTVIERTGTPRDLGPPDLLHQRY